MFSLSPVVDRHPKGARAVFWFLQVHQRNLGCCGGILQQVLRQEFRDSGKKTARKSSWVLNLRTFA